jgi:hypothetical protein
MAYLHCHTPGCGWAQDDFWDKEGYNPIKFMEDQQEKFLDDLFKDKVYSDTEILKEAGILAGEDEEGAYADGRAYVAWQLHARAEVIENMAVRTNEEWEKVKDTFLCPGCGKSDGFDID